MGNMLPRSVIDRMVRIRLAGAVSHACAVLDAGGNPDRALAHVVGLVGELAEECPETVRCPSW